MEKINFEALASKYGLTVDFVKELHEKVIDKENFARAVRMFAVGLLPYDMATGKAPINVAEYRHKVAVVICFHFSIFEPLETADYK